MYLYKDYVINLKFPMQLVNAIDEVMIKTPLVIECLVSYNAS